MPHSKSSELKNKYAVLPLFALGAVAGILYSLICFGFNITLLIAGFLAGSFIISLYVLIEFRLCAGKFSERSLLNRYIIRFIAYFTLFTVSLLLLSLLHAFFSQTLYGTEIHKIYFEDYYPYLPLFVLYAAMASLIFQSIWLFQALMEKEKRIVPASTKAERLEKINDLKNDNAANHHAENDKTKQQFNIGFEKV